MATKKRHTITLLGSNLFREQLNTLEHREKSNFSNYIKSDICNHKYFPI